MLILFLNLPTKIARQMYITLDGFWRNNCHGHTNTRNKLYRIVSDSGLYIMLYIINMTYKRQTEIKYFQATNPLIVLSYCIVLIFLSSVEINCKKVSIYCNIWWLLFRTFRISPNVRSEKCRNSVCFPSLFRNKLTAVYRNKYIVNVIKISC